MCCRIARCLYRPAQLMRCVAIAHKVGPLGAVWWVAEGRQVRMLDCSQTVLVLVLPVPVCVERGLGSMPHVARVPLCWLVLEKRQALHWRCALAVPHLQVAAACVRQTAAADPLALLDLASSRLNIVLATHALMAVHYLGRQQNLGASAVAPAPAAVSSAPPHVQPWLVPAPLRPGVVRQPAPPKKTQLGSHIRSLSDVAQTPLC